MVELKWLHYNNKMKDGYLQYLQAKSAKITFTQTGRVFWLLSIIIIKHKQSIADNTFSHFLGHNLRHLLDGDPSINNDKSLTTKEAICISTVH